MNGHPSGTTWHPLVGPGSCYFYVLVPPKKTSSTPRHRKVTSIEFSIALTQAPGLVGAGRVLGSWGPMDVALTKRMLRMDEGQLRTLLCIE